MYIYMYSINSYNVLVLFLKCYFKAISEARKGILVYGSTFEQFDSRDSTIFRTRWLGLQGLNTNLWSSLRWNSVCIFNRGSSIVVCRLSSFEQASNPVTTVRSVDCTESSNLGTKKWLDIVIRELETPCFINGRSMFIANYGFYQTNNYFDGVIVVLDMVLIHRTLNLSLSFLVCTVSRNSSQKVASSRSKTIGNFRVQKIFCRRSQTALFSKTETFKKEEIPM